jgi:predicted nucleotidyltransferase
MSAIGETRIPIPQEALREFCEHWGISELALFGSVLRDDFGPESDVDVLVTFNLTAAPTLLDLGHMERDLTALVGRRVDLVSRRGIERGPHTRRRSEILSSARVIYAAA